MTPTIKQPLFIISGASGVGKSTLCELLFLYETDYIVLESDIFWHDIFNTPEDNYKMYRQMWLRLCSNISQIGKPIVLCGCATPEQFEELPERNAFTDIFYLAVVCTNTALKDKMKNGRGISDEKWIMSSLEFNDWLIKNGESNGMFLLDNTHRDPLDCAKIADQWIRDMMNMVN